MVTEDVATPLGVTLPTDVDDVAADLSVTINQVPTIGVHGTVTYTPDGGGSATLSAGDVISVSELSTLVFTPVADFDGAVPPLTYTVANDDGASDLGSSGSVTILMVAVNDAPDAATDTVTTAEDTSVALSPTLPSDVDDLTTGSHHAGIEQQTCIACHDPHGGDDPFFLKRVEK